MSTKISLGNGKFCYSGPNCRNHSHLHNHSLKDELMKQLPASTSRIHPNYFEMKAFQEHINRPAEKLATLQTEAASAGALSAAIVAEQIFEENETDFDLQW